MIAQGARYAVAHQMHHQAPREQPETMRLFSEDRRQLGIPLQSERIEISEKSMTSNIVPATFVRTGEHRIFGISGPALRYDNSRGDVGRPDEENTLAKGQPAAVPDPQNDGGRISRNRGVPDGTLYIFHHRPGRAGLAHYFPKNRNAIRVLRGSRLINAAVSLARRPTDNSVKAPARRQRPIKNILAKQQLRATNNTAPLALECGAEEIAAREQRQD
jgi:hypothetical protein